jgi:Fe2+ transport system protein FeoA
MTLKELQIGQSGVVLTVGGEKALRHRLLEMGITPRTTVTVKKTAPLGDPVELLLRGYVLSLRVQHAEKITVEKIEGGDRHDTCACRKPELRKDHSF